MRLIVSLAFAISMGLLAAKGIAAETKTAADLDSVLSRLGYAGTEFKNNEHSEPLLPVELAGRHRVFLADTGCTMTTLQPGAATGLKTLGELGATLDDAFLGQITNNSVALMDKLVIGRAEFRNQPAIVEKLDMDFIRLPFDGILGLDFYFRNFCLIDCRRHKLYVRGRALSEDESVKFGELLHRSGFTDVPLQCQGFIAIDSKINNEPVQLLLDTGDSISVLDQSLASRLHLSMVKSDDPAEGSLIRSDLSGNLVGFNRIGSHTVRVARLSSFELGIRRWKDISYGVANLQAWNLAKAGGPGVKLEGMFGRDLLEMHGALIDFANRKLWLRPEKQRVK